MGSLWHLAVFLAVLLTVALGQRDETQSGCEVCASTGDCSRAYRGDSGQFCGNWLDRQSDRRPCCCPDNAVCKVSNYACNCGYSPHYAADGGIGLVWLWWLFGSLALLLCCCGCCFMASKRVRDRGPDNAIPVAQPVAEGVPSQPYGTTSTAYASAPPDQGYAGATPQYGRYYGQSRGGGGGMSAGTGAALGGTAGLLGGFLLGDAIADHGDGGGGGFDGGGGGDFGGGDF